VKLSGLSADQSSTVPSLRLAAATGTSGKEIGADHCDGRTPCAVMSRHVAIKIAPNAIRSKAFVPALDGFGLLVENRFRSIAAPLSKVT